MNGAKRKYLNTVLYRDNDSIHRLCFRRCQNQGGEDGGRVE